MDSDAFTNSTSGEVNNIIDQDGYQYISMGLATTFLLPQIYKAYTSKSLKDVSAPSMGILFLSGFLWTIYMYEHGLLYYACATTFVTMNAVIILLFKGYLCCTRVREHYKSFDAPVTAPVLVQNVPSEPGS